MNWKEKMKKSMPYVLIPFLIFAALETFYKLYNMNCAALPFIPAYLLAIVIVFAVYYLIMSLVNNSYITTIILSAVIFIFALANQIKIAYSDDPVFLNDILFINSPGTFSDILQGTLFDLVKEYFIGSAILLAVLILLCYWARQKKIKFQSKKKRLLTGSSCLLLLFLVFVPISSLNQGLLKVCYGSDRMNNYATTNMKYYYKYSIVSGLIGQLLENRLVEPKGFSTEKVEEMLAKVENSTEGRGGIGQPNIIMVFSESFWDIDQLDEITFDKPITENFNKLKEKGLFVDMISPSYGGISANPEWEMLTGGSLTYFHPGYIPYMQLYRDDKYYKAPSVISELKNNNYYTKIVTAWGPTLFNCDTVYDYYGVDEKVYRDNMKSQADWKGGRISDEFLTNQIMTEFNSKEAGEKMFYMVLTAQAHMPYMKDKYKDSEYDIQITDTKLSSDKAATVRSYAQGIYDADKQLGRLYEYIQTLEEDTILIFYGDHLPYLKTADGSDVFPDLEFFNTEDNLLNTFRKYNTQCLVLSNYEIEHEDISYLGPDMIMPYVLNKMDIQVSPFYQWLFSMRNNLPASNFAVSVDKEGNLYETSKLEGDLKEYYKMRSYMNWNYFCK